MSKQCMLEDNDLVKRYIQGDEKSLVILLKRHKRRVYSYIYMIVRKKEITEDIFQDTFYKVINSLKAGSYYEDGKFLPWVLRIARNLVIDHFRRVKKMPGLPCVKNEEGEYTDIFSILPVEQNDRVTPETEAFRKKMRQLIGQLSDEQKEVLMMRTYYDMSFKEIAERTDVSINTALGRMRYALINLKRMIEDQKVEIPIS